MKKFEIGQTYSMRSPCMYDCIWTYTVTKRTAQTITITDGKETKTCRISKQISENICFYYESVFSSKKKYYRSFIINRKKAKEKEERKNCIKLL